jgi:hypothetical protein
VTYLHTWGENRVYFHREGERHLVSMPASWTNIVPEDPVVVLGAGRAVYRVQDLIELAELIKGLARKEASSVKEIAS